MFYFPVIWMLTICKVNEKVSWTTKVSIVLVAFISPTVKTLNRTKIYKISCK